MTRGAGGSESAFASEGLACSRSPRSVRNRLLVSARMRRLVHWHHQLAHRDQQIVRFSPSTWDKRPLGRSWSRETGLSFRTVGMWRVSLGSSCWGYGLRVTGGDRHAKQLEGKSPRQSFEHPMRREAKTISISGRQYHLEKYEIFHIKPQTFHEHVASSARSYV